MKLTINTVAHYLPEKYSKYAEDTYRYKDQPVLSFPFSVKTYQQTHTIYLFLSLIMMLCQFVGFLGFIG